MNPGRARSLMLSWLMGGCRTHLEHKVSHQMPPPSLLLVDSLSLQESIRTLLPCAPRHHQPCLVRHSVPRKRAINHKAAVSMKSTLTGQVYNQTKSADLAETRANPIRLCWRPGHRPGSSTKSGPIALVEFGHEFAQFAKCAVQFRNCASCMCTLQISDLCLSLPLILTLTLTQTLALS